MSRINALRLLTSVTAIICFMIGSTAVFAAPPIPANFFGTALLDGMNVPDGTLIEAVINDVVYATAQTSTYQGESVFSIIVPGDDPDTPNVIEGGQDGDTIIFRIAGNDSTQNATWASGGGGQTALIATDNSNSGGSNPTPTPTPAPGDNDGTVQASFIGALLVKLQTVLFDQESLTGEDITINTTSTGWMAGDTTGTNAGWRVNLSAVGDFTNGNGNTIPLNGFAIQFDGSDITPRAGSGAAPSSLVANGSTITTSGIDILAASAGTGSGIYDFDPSFELLVPSTTIAGTYNTTIYVTITAGP